MSYESGCPEYRELTRRNFLSTLGKVAAAAGTAPAWLPKVVLAQEYRSNRDIMVSVYLRGGADGLTMCVPHGDADYYASRSTIAVPQPDSGDPNRAIDLDGFFGFPPALLPLVEAYQAGHLLIVHATGSDDPSRSHFDAQRFMEVGKPSDPAVGTGWLGRHLLTAPPIREDAALRGVGIGYGLPLTLNGGPKSLPIPSLDGYGITGYESTKSLRMIWMQQQYSQAGGTLGGLAHDAQATIDLLDAIDFAGYVPAGGAIYPTDAYGFGQSLKSVAALIRADVGVEALHLDLGGWDTHQGQGVFAGTMFNLMTALAGSLSALHKDLFAANRPDFTLGVVSEFGRVVAENGSGGTDHGHGNCLFLMGGNILGGRVLRNWPGLNRDNLYQGQDLKVTIDYRDILAEVVQKRLGNQQLGIVFPDYTPTFRGVCN